MRAFRLCLSLGVAAWLGACASTGAASAPSGGNRLLITAEELRAETSARTLEEVIRRLRPQWLTTRGPTSMRDGVGGIVVYRDGVPLGGVAVLQTMLVDNVGLVRFLSASEATTRFGTGHANGAILVESRQR